MTALPKPPKWRWPHILAVILGTAVALTAVNVIYTAQTQREADQRWCALLSSLDQPDVPATTERGRQIQIQIHQLRRGLGCGGTP